MNKKLFSNWIAFVFFGWLTAWLISASTMGYASALSDDQLYLALVPLVFMGACWAIVIAWASKSRFRWPMALLVTVFMALLTQWLFFLYLFARKEGFSMAHKAVYLYTDTNLWILIPQTLLISFMGMAQQRSGRTDSVLFWRFGYLPLLCLVGFGMWQQSPEALDVIENLDGDDPDSIACCDAVYGQLVEANQLKEQGSLTAIILTQQICEENFGIATTCPLISECAHSCSNRKTDCKEKTPGPACADHYWACLSKCHLRP